MQIITAEQAFAQQTRPWVLRSAAKFSERIGRAENSPRHRDAARGLRTVAKDLARLYVAANDNRAQRRVA